MAARSRRNKRGAYWGAFVLGWFKYLRDNDFTASDFKVLFFLCETMKVSDNRVYLKQKEIADSLIMDKGNVSKCIKKLCEKQFIAKTNNGFMINPHLFYVGKATRDERDELRDSFDELLYEKGIEHKFFLNEDEFRLERPLDEDGMDNEPFPW